MVDFECHVVTAQAQPKRRAVQSAPEAKVATVADRALTQLEACSEVELWRAATEVIRMAQRRAGRVLSLNDSSLERACTVAPCHLFSCSASVPECSACLWHTHDFCLWIGVFSGGGFGRLQQASTGTNLNNSMAQAPRQRGTSTRSARHSKSCGERWRSAFRPPSCPSQTSRCAPLLKASPPVSGKPRISNLTCKASYLTMEGDAEAGMDSVSSASRALHYEAHIHVAIGDTGIDTCIWAHASAWCPKDAHSCTEALST